jgi:hypothetical protein
MQSFIVRLVYFVVWFSNLTFWVYISKVKSALGHYPAFKVDPSPVDLGINSRLTDWVIRIAFASLWIGFAIFVDCLLFNRAQLKKWDIRLFVLGGIFFLWMIYSKSFGWYLD